MSGSALPPQVQLLAPREREVATIIYRQGSSTVKDILLRLSSPLKNASVRSMLRRLVAKGILDQHLAGRGRSQWHVYTPAITPDDVLRSVLQQLAEQYFRGSLSDAAKAIRALERRRRSQQPMASVQRKTGTAEGRVLLRARVGG